MGFPHLFGHHEKKEETHVEKRQHDGPTAAGAETRDEKRVEHVEKRDGNSREVRHEETTKQEGGHRDGMKREEKREEKVVASGASAAPKGEYEQRQYEKREERGASSESRVQPTTTATAGAAGAHTEKHHVEEHVEKRDGGKREVRHELKHDETGPNEEIHRVEKHEEKDSGAAVGAPAGQNRQFEQRPYEQRQYEKREESGAAGGWKSTQAGGASSESRVQPTTTATAGAAGTHTEKHHVEEHVEKRDGGKREVRHELKHDETGPNEEIHRVEKHEEKDGGAAAGAPAGQNRQPSQYEKREVTQTEVRDRR